MKKPTVLRLWPVLCTLFILSACQKETSTQQQEMPPNEQTNIHTTGALSDDPAKVAKVPLLVSAEFLKDQKISFSFTPLLNAKGKPVKSGADVTPPSISITSPANGAIVSGTVNVAVNATDNVGIKSVSLSVDDVTISTLTSAPYNFSWTADGNSHTITATAKDAAGNAASNTITVSKNTVTADITAPSVSITSPANGASVSGTVTISVNASDNIGVKSVSLSVDGAVVGTITASPYSFAWNTTNVIDGTHSLSAIAKDAAGNVKTSTITVAKNTTITTLPPTTLPANFSLTMPPVQNQGGEFSCVAFAIGYAARSAEQFYKNKATGYTYTTNIFSPEFLYNQTKISADCGSGTSIMQALDFMKSAGICTWQSMPYSYTNGCSLLPNGSQSSEAANYKISSYSAVYKSDVTAIKTSLINHHPVVFAAAIDNSFMNAQPGFIWKAYSGSPSISHAMAICGYDDSRHAWKVMNSWGTSWADNGYSWIDYDFLPQTGSVWTFVINL